MEQVGRVLWSHRFRKPESMGVVRRHCCHGTWGAHPGGQPGHVLAARLLETFLLGSPVVVTAHHLSGPAEGFKFSKVSLSPKVPQGQCWVRRTVSGSGPGAQLGYGDTC